MQASSSQNTFRIAEQTTLWAEHNRVPVEFIESCPSTNDLAKEESHSASLEGLPVKVYLSELQTNGRGRGNNTWSNSSAGQQLIMTVSLKVPQPPQPILSPRLGLALWSAARTSWPFLNWSLKAPNDLYLGSKKVAGILLENIICGEDVRTLIGVGMNIWSTPVEIETATHLVADFPAEVTLTPEDWFRFCDRFFMELSQAASLSFEKLNTVDQRSLLFALNQQPHLHSKYTQVDSDGSLWTGTNKKVWLDL